MTFQVDPAALRAYATRLDVVERVAGDATRYAEAHGSFGWHEAGIMGKAAPGHRRLMANLRELLDRLGELGTESQKALRATADTYLRTDRHAAAELDAACPPVPRPSAPRD